MSRHFSKSEWVFWAIESVIVALGLCTTKSHWFVGLRPGSSFVGIRHSAFAGVRDCTCTFRNGKREEGGASVWECDFLPGDDKTLCFCKEAVWRYSDLVPTLVWCDFDGITTLWWHYSNDMFVRISRLKQTLTWYREEVPKFGFHVAGTASRALLNILYQLLHITL